MAPVTVTEHPVHPAAVRTLVMYEAIVVALAFSATLLKLNVTLVAEATVAIPKKSKARVAFMILFPSA